MVNDLSNFSRKKNAVFLFQVLDFAVFLSYVMVNLGFALLVGQNKRFEDITYGFAKSWRSVFH